MSGRTVALFGGSFNPPHLAHQMVCLVVLETEPVDQVWMIPTHRHAFGKELAPYDDRVEMCRRAAAVFGGRVAVSTIEGELGRGGAESRTLHTVEALRARHPDTGFRLVVGEDILAEKDSWYRWDDLVALAPLIVVGRHSENRAQEAAGERIALPAISSTEVRARLGRGESALPLVPRAVMDYIAGRGLYR
ncbi:MAG TPA: nicotinate (nicotinamide) nucleotide adenylyltransferase [Kofleriaceae bacterium]|nr:nicotinate (nicotinamide) nucleotide adenylyltransferase [Kofleriaceae bacterium]